MSALCECGAKKNHAVHLRAVGLVGYHLYRDPTRAGLKAVSDGRRAYQQSEAHQEAYAAASAPQCLAGLAGAPGQCLGPLTPHHTLSRSQAGGLEAADKFPVVSLCAYHNDAIESDPKMRRWAERTTFERGGKEYPFRMRQTRKVADL